MAGISSIPALTVARRHIATSEVRICSTTFNEEYKMNLPQQVKPVTRYSTSNAALIGEGMLPHSHLEFRCKDYLMEFRDSDAKDAYSSMYQCTNDTKWSDGKHIAQIK